MTVRRKQPDGTEALVKVPLIRMQLVADGKSGAEIETAIAALSEPTRTQAATLWEYALEFRRAHPLVIQLGNSLGYDTGAKLDAFFVAAGRL